MYYSEYSGSAFKSLHSIQRGTYNLNADMTVSATEASSFTVEIACTV